MYVPHDYLKQLQRAPVPGPHCHQITGVVWAESWRRDVRKGIFQDSLFPIYAVGTDNVSFPKPESVALWPVDRSHRLNNLLLAIHPPAQFLNSVLVKNFDLIFITVVVLHVFSLSLADKFGEVAHVFRACRFRRAANFRFRPACSKTRFRLQAQLRICGAQMEASPAEEFSSSQLKCELSNEQFQGRTRGKL